MTHRLRVEFTHTSGEVSEWNAAFEPGYSQRNVSGVVDCMLRAIQHQLQRAGLLASDECYDARCSVAGVHAAHDAPIDGRVAP